MPAPLNTLKAALQSGHVQRGLWLNMCNAISAEICGHTGFDWGLIDAEHSPNGLDLIQSQLTALAGTPAQGVVRVPIGEDWVLKRVLDLGAQNILVPMVHDAEQARRAAAAVRYPPFGVRGMGATSARASRYGTIPDYAMTANEQICLMVQVESAQSVENIDEIASVEGVDVVFIGPADLSADMGYPGQLRHPKVMAAMDHVIARARAAGKAVGTIWFNKEHAQEAIDKGITFVGLGSDVSELTKALQKLAT